MGRVPILVSPDYDGFFRVWCLKISTRTVIFNGGIAWTAPTRNVGSSDFEYFLLWSKTVEGNPFPNKIERRTSIFKKQYKRF